MSITGIDNLRGQWLRMGGSPSFRSRYPPQLAESLGSRSGRPNWNVEQLRTLHQPRLGLPTDIRHTSRGNNGASWLVSMAGPGFGVKGLIACLKDFNNRPNVAVLVNPAVYSHWASRYGVLDCAEQSKVVRISDLGQYFKQEIP